MNHVDGRDEWRFRIGQGVTLLRFGELATLKDRMAACLAAPKPRRQIGLLLEGLIGGAERKNGWQLAEYAGDTAPWRMQALLGRTQWDEEKARDICRDYVIERLGDPSGVLVLDETGFLKKGRHSVGVARQYSGTAGRIGVGSAFSPSCRRARRDTL